MRDPSKLGSHNSPSPNGPSDNFVIAPPLHMTTTPRTKVLICYSRKDTPWLDRLRVHLKPLERRKLIEAWDDSHIGAGADWRAAIDRSLDEASVAVLLVSADWLASDFIQDFELPRLLARVRSEGVLVLPVLVSPCQVELTPLSGIQFVNGTDRPLIGLPEAEREAVLVRAAQAVLSALPLSAEAPAQAVPPPAPVDDQAARNELTDLLKRRFRQSERESLLFRLGFHPEDVKLRPEDREEFARAMVLHVDNAGRLADLWDAVYTAREVFLRGRRNPFR